MKVQLTTIEENVTLGRAISAAQSGNLVIHRQGWNGKGMFAYHVPVGEYPAHTDVARAVWGDALVPYTSYLALRGVDGHVSPWVPSMNDTLATDWVIASVVAEPQEVAAEEAVEVVPPAKPEMQHFIGTKIVQLAPMTRGDYNAYRGWKMPPEEKAGDEGYLVEYSLSNGDTPNHPNHLGYISWSPKSAADAAYRPVASTAMVVGELNVARAVHVERLLVEEADLSTKIHNLSVFMDTPNFRDIVGDAEAVRLTRQFEVMKDYHAEVRGRLAVLGFGK